MLDDEAAAPRKAAVMPTSARAQKGMSLYKIKTECDMIILGFVLATILLLVSDLNK